MASASSSFAGELGFIRGHINILTSLPITYSDNFQPPLDQYSKKISVFPVELPQPPQRKSLSPTTVSDTISIVFKSVKPPIEFPLSVSLSNTISTIKDQLALQPRAPQANIQRFLLKGKALADNKLLKEYGVTEGAVINLMIKPGSHWDGSETLVSTTSVPSVVVSTPGSAQPSPIPSDLSAASFPPVPQSGPEISSFHNTLASASFWERLFSFLQSEFHDKNDAAAAFEQFFLASKSRLTVGEIARIRDEVGIVGMAGT